MKLAFLLPSNCHKSTSISEEGLEEIYDFYEVHLLPNLFINLCGEYYVWCNSSLHSPVIDLPRDAVSAIEKCDTDALPRIGKLLHILCTMLVTISCAERFFFLAWGHWKLCWNHVWGRRDCPAWVWCRCIQKGSHQLTWTTLPMILPWKSRVDWILSCNVLFLYMFARPITLLILM